MKLHIDFETGGKAVIERIVEAYGFTTRLALAKHVGITSSSMSMRYKRDFFPSDLVVQCMAETGTRLEWLAFGTGKRHDDGMIESLNFQHFKLVDGQLFELGNILFDKAIFPPESPKPKSPLVILHEQTQYIIEKDFEEIHDGKWLINLEGKVTIRDLVRIPVKKVRVSGTGITFDCDINDIEVIGKVTNKLTTL
ncbi:phage repressor protein CI [Ewingella americana]|uniref:phage repressor protein CI n=1 Tax=Ewingella americana TaxID=41202 RepID=UPI00139DE312|nr:phage repressor protein CI [Ewingella americana]MRT03200.1 phage repressor protein [Ewingella americana]